MPTEPKREWNPESARLSDIATAREARHNYGPLPDEHEPDVYELMLPEPFDFEPCEKPCRISDCPCHYRDD
jgi:hypothetical protein